MLILNGISLNGIGLKSTGHSAGFLLEVIVRHAFAIVDLLVAIAALFIVIAIAFPWLQESREARRANECKCNLHNIALAALEYDVINGELPSYKAVPTELPNSEFVNNTNYQFTHAMVQLLPLLNEQKAADNIDPFAFSSKNATIQQMGYMLFTDWLGNSTELPGVRFVFQEYQPSFAICASDTDPIDGVITRTQAYPTTSIPFPPLVSSKTNKLSRTNYVANMGILGLTRTASLPPNSPFIGGYGPIRSRESDSVTSIVDGASNVVMFGEALGLINELPGFGDISVRHSFAVSGVALARTDFFGTGLDFFGDPSFSFEIQFGSTHPRTVSFARCDGSVLNVNRNVDPESFGKFCGAADIAKFVLD